MNYKVTFRKSRVDNVITTTYVEAESAEVAAKAVRTYYRVSHDDIVDVEPEEE